ncbi:MAG: hypothetical protein HP046_10415 [Parabacteroides sp.]|jgi:hypothetical protein|nr:hypothetical protein [Parabacteroides sp.]DAV65951.1 MAG TPA: hypothetical protein [Caudoviricetes sp.]DAZ44893.1 MAG TPA: hypothetical protein [Caudoviricetes sp.]
MEENKNLPASEARRISEQNQLTVTQAMKIISEDAGRGQTMSLFFNLHQDTITYLLKYGYKISKHTDPMGLEAIRVEW